MSRGRAFVGILLIVLGALFLLDRSGVLDAGDTIAQWWPVILVVAGLMYFSFSPPHVIIPGILIIVGLALLAGTLDFIDQDLTQFIWPIVLVLIGLWVIVGPSRRGTSVADRVNSVVAFWRRATWWYPRPPWKTPWPSWRKGRRRTPCCPRFCSIFWVWGATSPASTSAGAAMLNPNRP